MAAISRFSFTNQSLAVRFSFAAVIVMLFSALSIAVLFRQFKRHREVAEWLTNNHATVSSLNVLARNLYSEHAAVAGYLRTHDRQLTNILFQARKQFNEQIQGISKQLSPSPTQSEVLEDIRKSHELWLKLIETVLAGKSPRPTQSEADRVFNDANSVLDQAISQQERFIDVREETDLRTNQNTFRIFLSATIFSFFIFIVILVNLYDSIAAPITSLSQGIRRFERGDHSARLRVSGNNEIGYLESSFNQMAQVIENMVKDLKQVDAMKSTFLSTVSHELRTPLTSISGYVKLILSGDVGALDPTQGEFLAIVDTNVSRLANLINDILDVEKIESGRLQLDLKPQDLRSVLKECQDTFGIVAKQKHLKFQVTVPETEVLVQADRSRLVQIFMNLMSNAIKYTKEGNVLVEMEKRSITVVVRITDTGFGMGLDEQNQLFKKFTRTRSGLQSGEGGTGLGLVIVKELIEAHGGNIRVDSEPGRGSTFFVTLPLLASESVQKEEAQAQAQPKKVVPASDVRNIWVISKDALDTGEIKAVFKENEQLLGGVSVNLVFMQSAAEAHAVSNRDEAPLLVIYDAEADGQEYEEKLLELRIGLQGFAPVIVLGSVTDALVAFSGGASALLTKPLSRQRLVASVKNIIGTKPVRILIADPDRDFKLLIRRRLEQRGFQIDDCDSAKEVLARIEQIRYDMVLIELEFPDLGGKDLVHSIRGSERYQGLEVSILSNQKNSLNEKELIEMGANAHYNKGDGLDRIVDEIAARIEKKSLIEQFH